MERSEIVSQILAILEDVAEISPEDVTEDSVLMDDLDLSSMEILTVVADLEETFGLRIPEKELRNFDHQRPGRLPGCPRGVNAHECGTALCFSGHRVLLPGAYGPLPL